MKREGVRRWFRLPVADRELSGSSSASAIRSDQQVGYTQHTAISKEQTKHEEEASVLLDAAYEAMPRLKAAFPSLSFEQLEDAATSAAWELWLRRLSGAGARIVYMAAWRNARDLSASERARREREHRWAAEWQQHSASASMSEDLALNACFQIAGLLNGAEERSLFWLMATGFQARSSLVHCLGLEGAPEDVQAAEIKRAKDRLRVRLKRDPRIRAIAAAGFQRDAAGMGGVANPVAASI
jgi:hypothetical protein